ncbi:polymer-forming cytoskeletal protein [Rossellomorea aquimaris]|uniref:polymer-forming cytoskeletal protein n=1 Tax=Rossellomorea aquimaris TaxID=189382 RepID=UPI0007D0AA0C|nr:polymer-forming cytoskeletal protein [Rossellomorea aquimaris]
MNTAEKQELHDLKISGSGSSGGGQFNKVKISGSGKISGDIDCKELKISGSGKINGNIKTGYMKSSGSSHIHGDLKAEKISISGSSKFEGSIMAATMEVSGSSKVSENLICKDFKASGSCVVQGKLQGENVKSSGLLKVLKDCEVETFTSHGAVTIDGLLSADKVDIQLEHQSSIKEIGGETIVVKNQNSTRLLKQVVNFFFQKDDHLHSDLIEGDEVYLENTKAKLVRGKNVVIGENCEIETVEYSGSLDIKKESKVQNQVKM